MSDASRAVGLPSPEQVVDRLRIALEKESETNKGGLKFALADAALHAEIAKALQNNSRAAVAKALAGIYGKSTPTVRRALNDVFPAGKKPGTKPGSSSGRGKPQKEQGNKRQADESGKAREHGATGAGSNPTAPVGSSDASAAISKVNAGKSLFAKVKQS